MAREEELELDGNSAKTRIYVGGLGGTVTEDDLRNTFSPLGKLQSVQIVRSKNRSFAYLDFVPSSDKSLAKLFSTYNGCIWKGGRLRLEKAKEHYLVRMKREWTEEAELATKALASKDDLSNNTVSFEKPNKFLAAEKPQLRFFFPKLMKMKSLPFNGTGKHKYSFQRIQVPSYPLHFCDCEEHSNPSEINKGISCVDVENEHGGIKDQEFDMMNSVLNKFLAKNNPPIDTGGQSLSAEEKIDKMIVDENEENQADSDDDDDDDDDDNIVINIVKGGKDSLTSYQEFNMNKPQHSIQKTAQKDTITGDKKRKSPLLKESEKNEITAFTPKKKNILKSTSNQPANYTESTRPLPQKPKWKRLVGKTENTQFSISQILPEVPSSKESQPKKSRHGDFLESQIRSVSDVKEPENHTKVTINGNSESQLIPLVEVKKPETNDEDLLKKLSSESQLTTSKEVNKVDEASKNNNTSGRGAFWKQNSSWTQLISTTTARSFSISQVLPGLTFESQKSTEDITAVNTGLKEELSNNFEVTKDKVKNILVPELPTSSSEKKSAKNEDSDKKLTKEAEIWNWETCPFMRTEASMKEWMKTKTALSGSLKKKGNNGK